MKTKKKKTNGKLGLNIENGKLTITDVIDRLKAMRADIELVEFDKNKEKDFLYCVEWGIKKGQWFEQNVIDRYINELNELK
jgi:hypothetical protein